MENFVEATRKILLVFDFQLPKNSLFVIPEAHESD